MFYCYKCTTDEISTIPVGDAPPFSERSNDIYLMKSIEVRLMVKFLHMMEESVGHSILH